MQKIKPIKETIYEFLVIVGCIFVIACTWAIVVLISYLMFLFWKWIGS